MVDSAELGRLFDGKMVTESKVQKMCLEFDSNPTSAEDRKHILAAARVAHDAWVSECICTIDPNERAARDAARPTESAMFRIQPGVYVQEATMEDNIGIGVDHMQNLGGIGKLESRRNTNVSEEAAAAKHAPALLKAAMSRYRPTSSEGWRAWVMPTAVGVIGGALAIGLAHAIGWSP